MYSDESDSLNGQSKALSGSVGVKAVGHQTLLVQLESGDYSKYTLLTIPIPPGTWRVMYDLHLESAEVESLGGPGAASRESH